MLLALLLASAHLAAPGAPAERAFADGVKHYRDGTGKSDYARHPPDAQAAIAENILRHQRANGGWASNWDPLRILDAAEVAQLAADQGKLDTTFDNRATYPQMTYLAAAFNSTGDERFRDAALRGLQFILEAQYPNGGWPHSFPNPDNYRPHITFMDDVMAGVLTALRPVAAGAAPFGFVAPDLRDRAADAVRRGDALLLRLQVVVDGAPTVWAGQYDRATLQPVMARTFELPSLVSAESVGVVQYLMGIDTPSPAIIQAVEHAVRWFERSKIEGIRIDSVSIDPIRYDHHTATTDRIVVADPTAPPVWARFYEIDTNRPFMANRDGKKVYTLAEVAHERRTGYAWYTVAPAQLLEKDYPAWRARWGTGG
jgi:PelA/Pel-15E family pectate lyase